MTEPEFPYMIDWAITERCNLRCRHCRGMLAGDLSTPRARQLVDEIAELKPAWVIVEGGEPLLRPDLFELLEALREKHLEVHLISNGTLLKPRILDNLKGLGVKLMLSIDGATAATYEAIRAGSSFNQVITAARQGVAAGLLEAINFTILKENYREIPQIFALAASIGVPNINFIGLKPCFNYTAELLTAAECGEAIRLACQSAQHTGVRFFFDEPFFQAAVQEWGLAAQIPAEDTGIVVPSATSCIFGRYLFIEPSGDVKPCSFAPEVVGNVKEQKLTAIWRGMLSSPFFRRIKEMDSRSGYCRSCQYLSQCGGCRSRTRVLTGDWFASDPVCPLATSKVTIKEKKMRVVGIDPGTGSFDLFGREGEKIILDTSLPVSKVAENPAILLETVKEVSPVDIIVGPSGYGLPVSPISDMGDRELDLMVPDDKSIPLYGGIRMVLRLMKEQGFPIYFTPGVIHLSTVPAYRKANKLDMGTADKVCCTALAIRDQAERYHIDYNRVSFILAEVGFAFSAIIAVEGGKIVDGLGGTIGGPGFLTAGNIDGELALRLRSFPGLAIFTGGARYASGKDDLAPEEMARAPEKYQAAWNMLLESVAKGVAAMTVSVPQPREILLSGRLTRIPQITQALNATLSRFGTVRLVGRQARTAKEAAEGAYIIGEGLLGGKYQALVDGMELRNARGTMFDHILLKGIEMRIP